MLEKQFVVSWLILTLTSSISAEYNVDGVCALVSNGVRIGSIDSCQRYYVCNNGKATANDCPPGTSFSKDEQNCLTETSVQCFISQGNPCARRNEGFVPKSGTCNGWIYCKNGKEAGSGQCAGKLIFNNGECTFGSCPSADSNGLFDANFKSICQIMMNDKYFGSSSDCGKWQVCKNDKLVTGFCQTGLAYDVATESCNYENENTCSQVTDITVQPDPENYGPCTTEGEVKPSRICSDHLKCENSLWKKYSCNTNYYYDITTKSCQPRNTAKTYDCNRCQFSRKQFVNAVDTECRKYIVCNNGAKKSSNSCAIGFYFDEVAEACIKGNGKDSKASNGACFVPSNDTPPQQPGDGGNETPPQQPGDGGNETPPQQPGDGGNETPPQQPGNGGNETPPQQPGEGANTGE
ncbi:peritrophin-48 [Zeugodacus cucurbitae]|nr:peritrophin-48 [Zeugodacus cucurbitae]